MERYSSAVGSVGGEQIPLGVYYLASYLRQNGYDVSATDAEALKLTDEDILHEIGKVLPDFVGISSTTVSFHRALWVANKIKNNFPDIKIILGGPHISSNINHAMGYDVFDYGVIGEGEITCLELLNAISNRSSLAQVKGIAFRDTNNQLIINPKREYISDLDTLPFPAYDLIPNISLYTPPPANYRTLPVINMITSRGCPNHCTFCDRNVFGSRYRERSAINVVKEIEYLKENYHIKEIAFVDDTFLINTKRIREIFSLLQERSLHFYWSCMARINNVDLDFLRYLKENGCWNIAFGIESGTKIF